MHPDDRSKYNVSVLMILLFLTTCASRSVLFDTSFSFANTSQGLEISVSTRGRHLCNFVSIRHRDGTSSSCFTGNNTFEAWFWIDSSYDTETNRFIGLNTYIAKSPRSSSFTQVFKDSNQYPMAELYNMAHVQFLIANCTMEYQSETFDIFIGTTRVTRDGYCNNGNNIPQWVSFTNQMLSVEDDSEKADASKLFHPYYMERIELLYPGWLIGQIGLCIGLGLLLLILRHKQPLASRGILPIIQVISQIIYLCADLPVFWAPLQAMQYNCFIVWCFQYNSMLVSIVLMIFHFIRFMVIMNMENIKKTYACIGTTQEIRVTNKLMCFKYLGRGFLGFGTSIIITAFFAMLYLCLPIIMQATQILNSFRYGCSDLSVGIGRLIYNSIIITIGSIGCLILLVDFLVHICHKKCSRFLIGDNYYYRLEIYGFTLIVFLIYVPTTIIGYTVGFGGVLGSSIRNTILCNMLLFACAVFPLILTFFYMIRQRCCTIKVNRKLLDKIVRTDEFQNFAQSECSTENASCYIELQEFKCAHINQRRVVAKRCIALYLKGDSSPLEIHISTSIANQVIKKYEKNLVDEHLFDEVENVVVNALSDTITRFMISDTYLEQIRREKEKYPTTDEESDRRKDIREMIDVALDI